MHYAWLILFCCCMVELGSLGIINCVGLFLAPVCADLGVGAADFSLYLSFQMLSIALTAAPCNCTNGSALRKNHPKNRG